MKTKLFFFILLLVMGVGNGLAQSTSRDSLLQEIKNARNFAENWDTIPGSENDKVLAILTGKKLQIQDSIIDVRTRRFGSLFFQKVYYTRHIYYDEKNKLLKKEIKFSQKETKLWTFIILGLQGFLLLVLYLFARGLYSRYAAIRTWVIWCIFLSALIYISYYLGTLCAIVSLIYIFKDKIFQRQNQRKYKK